MRFEAKLETMIELFSRSLSVQIDISDWDLRLKTTKASVVTHVGPLRVIYTNHSKLVSYFEDLIKSIDKDFENYQVSQNAELELATNESKSNNILH